MNLRENLTLPFLDRFRPLVRTDRSPRQSVGWQRSFAVNSPFELPASKPPRIRCPGGINRKSCLPRGLPAGSRILLIDEPTRGVDVGAKQGDSRTH